ncbi:MAG: PQQ-binding-like beta-propeller repeat protein [candidate division WOR-3 bacterium]
MANSKLTSWLVLLGIVGFIAFFLIPENSNGENFPTHPWSHYHANPQRTGLSQFSVGDSFEILWTFNVGAEISGSPVVDNRGRVIFGARNARLYCLSPNGEMLWTTPLSYTVWFSTPALDDSGNIYITDGRHLFKIDSGGRIIWSWPGHNNLSITHSPVIGKDGKIYFACYSDSLYALKPDGNLDWAEYLGRDVNSSPTVGHDGRIYVATTRGNGPWHLWAFNPNGTVAWVMALESGVEFATPAVGPDSTIYVGAGRYLYAVRADGTLRWRDSLGATIQTSPAVANESTIYVNTGSLYCLDSRSGAHRWVLQNLVSYFSAPAVDAEGNIYVGSDRTFYIISPEGRILCSRTIATSQSLFASPAIGPNQRVYFGHMNGLFFACQGYGSTAVREGVASKREREILIIPNPSVNSAKILYRVSVNGKVSLTLYDKSGRLIANLIDKSLSPGFYSINFSPDNLPKGVYFLHFKNGIRRAIKEIIFR